MCVLSYEHNKLSVVLRRPRSTDVFLYLKAAAITMKRTFLVLLRHSRAQSSHSEGTLNQLPRWKNALSVCKPPDGDISPLLYNIIQIGLTMPSAVSFAAVRPDNFDFTLA